MWDLMNPIVATFTAPEHIGTDPGSVLWVLPLAASIAVVYKATKVSKVAPRVFVKESALLFGSIIVFIVVAAVILYGLTWIVTEQLPALLNPSTF